MKTLAFFLMLFCLASAGTAWSAGALDMTTYYDAPDGDFKTLTVTGNVQLATAGGNVTVATGGGNMLVGTAVPTAGASLVVRGSTNNLISAAFMKNNGYGVAVGSTNAVGYGILAGKGPNSIEAPLFLNATGNAPVVFGALGGAAPAQVVIAGGAGNLRLTQSGQTGDLKVNFDTDGYYATYA